MKTEQNSVVPRESKGLPPTPNILDHGLQDRRDWWTFFVLSNDRRVQCLPSTVITLTLAKFCTNQHREAVCSARWIVSGCRTSTAVLALLSLPTHRVLALPESSLLVWSLCGVFYTQSFTAFKMFIKHYICSTNVGECGFLQSKNKLVPAGRLIGGRMGKCIPCLCAVVLVL